MNRFLLSLTAGAVLIGLTAGPASATGWRRTGGPVAYTVTAFAADNQYTYAGQPHSTNVDNGGVYRSADYGRTWQWMTDPATGFHANNWPYAPDVRALTFKGTSLWAATSQGVFVSTNQGQTWTARNIGLTGAAYDGTDLVVAANGNLLLSTWGNGIYISTDDGQTWFSTNNGLTGSNNSYNVRCLLVTPAALYAGMESNQGGLFKSLDGGQNWAQVLDSAGNALELIYSLGATSTGTLLAGRHYNGFGIADGGFWRTNATGQWVKRNGGNTPNPTGLPYPCDVLKVTGDATGVLWAGTTAGLYKSTTGGRTWVTASGPGLESPVITALLLRPGAEALVGTAYAGGADASGNAQGGGVYRTLDGGQSWLSRSYGLASPVSAGPFRVIGNRFYTGTENASGAVRGVFGSTDGGHSWQHLSTGLIVSGIVDFAAHGANLFAASYGGGVYRSADQGQTWTVKNNGLTSQTAQALAVLGNTLFVGTLGGGVYRSTNDGDNWNTASIGLPASNPYVYALAEVGGVLVAGMESVGILRSTNGGNSWVPTSITSGRISALLTLNATTILAATNNPGGVWRSTDQGATWTAIANSGLNSVNALSRAANGYVFAVTNNGVFFSADQGLSWHKANRGLTTAVTEADDSGTGSIAVWGDTVYTVGYQSGSAAGIFRRPLSEFVAIVTGLPADASAATRGVEMGAIYPNPAAAGEAAQLPLTLAQPATVGFVLSDLLGRSLATPPAGSLPAGAHTLPVPTAGLAPGLYLLRLTTGGTPGPTRRLVIR